MKKTIPTFDSDEKAQEFVATANLAQSDLSGGKLAHFEFEPKQAVLTMRLPRGLLDAVRMHAKARGLR